MIFSSNGVRFCHTRESIAWPGAANLTDLLIGGTQRLYVSVLLATACLVMEESRQVPMCEWREEQGNTSIPENTAMESKMTGNTGKFRKRCWMESNAAFTWQQLSYKI